MGDRAIIQEAAREARGAGEWKRAKCPVCEQRTGKPDRRGALAINEAEGVYYCHKCQASGRLRDGPRDWSPKPPQAATSALTEADRLPDGFTPMWKEPGRSAIVLGPAREYLARRRVSDDIVRAARIGACFSGRMMGRVVVPVLEGDAVRGWVARAWWNGTRSPYLYPSGMRRAELLYNAAALAAQSELPVIVVEGVFDALAYWPDGVAVLGKPSEQQVVMLARAKRPVAVVLDGDAWHAGRMLAERLRFEGQRAGWIRLPPQVDPDEVDRAWLRGEATRCLSLT